LGDTVPDLTPELEITAFRVAQEAVTNAIRHAKARRIEVAVEPVNGTLSIRVHDDGKGFDVQGTVEGSGDREVHRPARHAGAGQAAGRGPAHHLGTGPRHDGAAPAAPGELMTKTRIVLADDHTLVRGGIRALLESIPGVEVVAESGDGREALELIAKHEPEVALLDIGMPSMNGLEVARQASKDHPRTKVVILSMHADPAYVKQALQAGVAGYLLKGAAVAELPLALQSVMRGETYLTPKISQAVVHGFPARGTGGGGGAGRGRGADPPPAGDPPAHRRGKVHQGHRLRPGRQREDGGDAPHAFDGPAGDPRRARAGALCHPCRHRLRRSLASKPPQAWSAWKQLLTADSPPSIGSCPLRIPTRFRVPYSIDMPPTKARDALTHREGTWHAAGERTRGVASLTANRRGLPLRREARSGIP
jgi:DNA-binding NarL/FixJ family response regulator